MEATAAARPSASGPTGDRPARRGGRSGAREAILVAFGLTVLCALAYGVFVADGGFYWDDWQLAARARYPPLVDPNFWGPVDLSLLKYRPVIGLVLPGLHLLIGPTPWAHILVGLAINVAVSLCFFLLLRRLGLPAPPAALAAALVLLFPWADAQRFWPTAAVNALGVIFALLGAMAALAGLRAPERPRRVGLTVLALVLLALATLSYELVAVPALLMVVVYAGEVGVRRGLRRWVPDLVVVAASLALVASNQTRRTQSLDEQLTHAKDILDAAVTLFARVVEPFGSPPRGLVLGGVALLVTIALAVAARRPPGDPARAALRGWVVVLAACLVAALASYALLVPADEHYSPLAPGVNNRINLVAALPFGLAVVALAMLAGTLVAVAVGRGRALVVAGDPRSTGRGRPAAVDERPAAAQDRSAAAPGASLWCGRALNALSGNDVAIGVALVLVALVAAGYWDRLVDDRNAWVRGAEVQERVLRAVERSLPADRPRASVVYTFGAPTYVAPGIPAFSVSWDLNGAVRLRLRDRRLRSYPIPPDGLLACRRGKVEPLGISFAPRDGAPYGRAYFIDVPTGRAIRIEDRAGCERARALVLRGYR